MTRVKALLSATVVASLAAVVILAGTLPNFWIYLVTTAGINALIALSVGVTFGYIGISSLCQLSFAAAGAWITAKLVLDFGLPVLVAVLAGAVVAGVLGTLVGVLALRLRDVDLMVVTLAFAIAFQQIIGNVGFPGGAGTLFIGRPSFLANDRVFMIATWGAFAVVAGAMVFVSHRRLGRSWLAIKHSERSSAAMGMRLLPTRLMAIAIGAAIAGFGGSMLLVQQGVIDQASFSPMASLTIFLAAVMSGARYVEGAVMAGLFSTIFPVVLTSLGVSGGYNNVLFAVGAIQVLATGREGMAADIRSGLRRLLRATKVVPAAAVLETGTVAVPPAAAVAASRRRDADATTRAAGGAETLSVSGVTVSFSGVPALRDVDFSMDAGSVVGLIGPNGAGKSTFVDIVSGFTRSYSGDVRLGEDSMNGWGPQARARAGVRRTFQRERTIPELTIGEYVALASPHGHSVAIAEELAATFRIPALSTRIERVDIGTRRLIEVVAAAASSPRFLLLDEPAAGLGEAQVESLIRGVSAIPAICGAGVLVIEHDMRIVSALCQSITVLNFGQVIASGAPDDVLSRDLVVSAYLGGADIDE